MIALVRKGECIMRKPTKIALATILLAAIACQLLIWNHTASSKRVSRAEEAERPIYNHMYQPSDLLW
jgi:hypothetical protein